MGKGREATEEAEAGVRGLLSASGGFNIILHWGARSVCVRVEPPWTGESGDGLCAHPASP